MKKSSNLKICMITDGWDSVWGGGQTYVWEISKKLSHNYNHSVDIVTPNIKGPERKNNEENITVIRLGPKFKFPNFLGRSLFSISLLFFLLKSNYDIYHANGYSTVVFFPLVRLFKKGKTIFTLHGLGSEISGGKIFSYFGLVNILNDLIIYKYRYNALISVAKDSIRKKVTKSKLFFIGTGVNLEDYDKVKESVKSGNHKLLWVGRIASLKNLPLLIKIVIKLKPEFPHLSLSLVGSGSDKEKLEELIKTERASDFIQLVGFKTGKDLIETYKSSDIYVLPSISGEGFPISIVEAMAAKLPVIATDVGDTRVLVNKDTGYLVKPIDQEDLEEKIVEALKSNKNKELGKNGYNLVKEKYTWDIIAKKINEVYETV